MLLSDVRLSWISEEKGYGLFAQDFIPKGTITFVNDNLDIVIKPKSKKFQSKEYQDLLNKYAYNSPRGELVVCWDFGKYINHCCWSNTLTTGYGFDIAISDIHPGEELTTDYGVIATEHPMTFSCPKENCRKVIDINSFDSCVEYWDSQIKNALTNTKNVDQPLWSFIPPEILKRLESYLAGKKEDYLSVITQKPNSL